MFKITFYEFKKPKNSTARPKGGSYEIELEIEFWCVLKERTSFVRPVFILNASEVEQHTLYGCNYCTAPLGGSGRCYYITDIVQVTATIVEISCVVDVLATYQNYIFETNAYVQFASSAYDNMLPDDRFPPTNRTKVSKVEIPFPFTISSLGCYVVKSPFTDFTVPSASSGAVTAVAMTPWEFYDMVKKLNSRTLLDALANSFKDIASMILGVVWLPFDRDAISSGIDVKIRIDNAVLPDYIVGQGKLARKTLDNMFNTTEITPDIPYKWNHFTPMSKFDAPNAVTDCADFRNFAPWTTYDLYLPGFGLQQVALEQFFQHDDPETAADDPKIIFDIALSPLTGDITYKLRGNHSPTNSPFLIVKGRLGVDIPISSSSPDIAGALNNLMNAAGSVVGAVVSPQKFIGKMYVSDAIQSGAQSLINLATTHRSTTGALDPWTEVYGDYSVIKCITTHNIPCENPEVAKRHVGRILKKTRKLKEMRGYVACSGAFVKAPATDEELDTINSFLNISDMYAYGGTILEV